MEAFEAAFNTNNSSFKMDTCLKYWCVQSERINIYSFAEVSSGWKHLLLQLQSWFCVDSFSTDADLPHSF